MPRPKTDAAEYVRTCIRIPKEIFTLVQQQAATHDRPVNTEVIHVLRRGLQRKKRVAALAAEGVSP